MTGQFATDHVDEKAWTGRVLAGKYRLEQCIGRSADTMVYRAMQLNLRRDVAVKVLFANPGGSMQLGDRMRREARLVAAIRHPGVAEMYDEGVTDDGRPYLVMELLRGQTLEDFIAVKGRLPVKEAVKILQEIAAVLGAVHDAGYVHRDIKPSNVFLEQSGSDFTIKLIDFGTARPVAARFEEDAVAKKTLGGLGAGTQINTLPGIVFGTPSYMSPEQCRGDEVDSTTDIYSLGVVFYLMVAGSLPFEDVHAVRVMARHLVEIPPKLRERVPDATELVPLEPVLARVLMKDRHERYRTTYDFAEAASRACSGATDTEVSVPPGVADRDVVTNRPDLRASEQTRPAKRHAKKVPTLSRGWVVAATVVSVGGLFIASVFALARYGADATEEDAVGVASSAAGIESPRAAASKGEPAIGNAVQAAPPVFEPEDFPLESTTAVDARAAPVRQAATRPSAATANAAAPALSAQKTQEKAATPQASQPQKPARRFSFGLNELMRPRGAQEK